VLLLDEAAAGSLVAERMSGAWYGIQQILGPLPEKLLTRADCGGQRDQAQKITEAFLKDRPRARRILIGSINDASGLGALDVVRRLKREQQVAIVGQDCIEEALSEIANPASSMLASVAHFPETYGAQVVELVLRLLRGEQVAPVTYTQHQLITRRNYKQYPLLFNSAPAETA
jgi:ribose transport system substrate-binding protein